MYMCVCMYVCMYIYIFMTPAIHLHSCRADARGRSRKQKHMLHSIYNDSIIY